MDKIVEFLRSDMVLNILALLPQRNALRVEELSLFERFAALCDGLPHLDGNECAEAFLGYLGDALRCSVTPENLCTRDQQKSAWRALAEHNRAPQLTCESFCFADVQRCSIDCEDIASHIKNARTDDLEQVSCELSKKSELCIDLDGFCYTRPDEYHASLTYSSLLRRGVSASGRYKGYL
jgi:hypothetical protein